MKMCSFKRGAFLPSEDLNSSDQLLFAVCVSVIINKNVTWYGFFQAEPPQILEVLWEVSELISSRGFKNVELWRKRQKVKQTLNFPACSKNSVIISYFLFESFCSSRVWLYSSFWSGKSRKMSKIWFLCDCSLFPSKILSAFESIASEKVHGSS